MKHRVYSTTTYYNIHEIEAPDTDTARNLFYKGMGELVINSLKNNPVVEIQSIIVEA